MSFFLTSINSLFFNDLYLLSTRCMHACASAKRRAKSVRAHEHRHTWHTHIPRIHTDPYAQIQNSCMYAHTHGTLHRSGEAILASDGPYTDDTHQGAMDAVAHHNLRGTQSWVRGTHNGPIFSFARLHSLFILTQTGHCSSYAQASIES